MMTANLNPSIQLIIISALALLAGMLIGWVVIGRIKKKIEQRLLDELTGLRTNFAYVREDAHDLRVQLKEAEKQRIRLSQLLESTSGHEKFLKVRTELETARKGIQALKALLGKREKENFLLKEKIYKYRQHRNASSPLHPIPLHLKKLPSLSDGKDDLKLIQGIDDLIEHKLHSLGIVSYRQLAECSPAQLMSIQKLIGQDQALPLRHWVKTARELFIGKYNYSENDENAFATRFPSQQLQSRRSR